VRRLLAAVALALVTSGCSGEDTPDAEPAAPSTTTSTPTEPAPSSTSTPAPEPEPTESALPPVTNPLSLPALMREDFPAGRIRPGAVIEQASTYTRRIVTYRSGDGLTISGVLLRPRGRGPFPGIVLNHGYIEPSIYEPGQGLAREQVALANAGFVVLHTDYRGHAGSDPVRPLDRESRLGYARDAIHAVLALEREPYVDPERMAMLGRSMGGGVTLDALVVHPGLVQAAVTYASVSSDFVDNLRQFTEPNRPEAAQRLYDRFGTPAEAPEFYAGLSPRTYFDRITEPLLVHHGTVDDTCPPRWARATERLMQEAGVRSTLVWYEGEGHTFYAQWQRSMDRTIRFLNRQLSA
jgi:dipeptidyl aminopeptidase/acylaminoacyl peptidase